jgi:hypothetical protein
MSLLPQEEALGGMWRGKRSLGGDFFFFITNLHFLFLFFSSLSCIIPL